MMIQKSCPSFSRKIKSVPRIRQFYWCAFYNCAPLPEFHSEHPALVINTPKSFEDPIIILPCTSSSQPKNQWAHKLSFPLVGTKTSWIICNHPYTVSCDRLRPIKKPMPVASEEEFNHILKRCYACLPEVR